MENWNTKFQILDKLLEGLEYRTYLLSQYCDYLEYSWCKFGEIPTNFWKNSYAQRYDNGLQVTQYTNYSPIYSKWRIKNSLHFVVSCHGGVHRWISRILNGLFWLFMMSMICRHHSRAAGFWPSS